MSSKVVFTIMPVGNVWKTFIRIDGSDSAQIPSTSIRQGLSLLKRWYPTAKLQSPPTFFDKVSNKRVLDSFDYTTIRTHMCS